jgi:predicted NACHT family NTPase
MRLAQKTVSLLVNNCEFSAQKLSAFCKKRWSSAQKLLGWEESDRLLLEKLPFL